MRTGTVVPYKVIVLNEHRPPRLLLGEILRRLEVCQVPMIHNNGDRVLCASEILVPLFKYPYDCKDFAIIDIIVFLSGSKSL